MSLRAQFEAITATLPGPPAFVFGTQNEINLFLDSIAGPAVCLLANGSIGMQLNKSGAADNEYSPYMMFIQPTKFENFTGDNETVINEMQLLATRFLAYVRDYKVDPIGSNYFKWDDKQKAIAYPLYNKKDVNSSGVSLSFKVSTVQSDYLLNC